MVKTCIVKGCRSRTGTRDGNEYRFFSIPAVPKQLDDDETRRLLSDRQKRWVEAAGCDASEFELKKHHRICSAHFVGGTYCWIKLSKNATSELRDHTVLSATGHMWTHHRLLKLWTDGCQSRIRKLGCIDVFVVTSLKMNQLSPNFEHKLPIMSGILATNFFAIWSALPVLLWPPFVRLANGWYLICLPRRDGRLSWPMWPVTYRDGLPIHRQSPIQVLTWQCTARSWTCNLLITSPMP